MKFVDPKTWTAEELDIYEAQEFKIAINQNVIETALMDGIAQRIAKGIEQGIHNIRSTSKSLSDCKRNARQRFRFTNHCRIHRLNPH